MRTVALFLVLVSIASSVEACGRLVVRTAPAGELAIRYQRIEVTIDNQVAITRVRQQFVNETDQALLGEYLFDLPPGASVSDFAIFDGARRVPGVVRRREVARAIFDELAARRASPGLLEQVDDRSFKAQVANIPPRSEKKIELEYREMLALDSGLVRYKLPLSRTDGTRPRVKEMVLTIALTDGAAIDAVWSNLSAVAIHHHDAHTVGVSWEATDPVNDRDFELDVKIRPPAAGMRARFHRADQSPGYVMLSISPPEEPSLKRPKDVVFVVDTSGSMEGKKMEQAKRALRYCLSTPAPEDRFNLVRFCTGTNPYESGLRTASVEELDRARTWVDGLTATGGTDIHAGMMLSLTHLAVTSDRDPRPRYVVLVTDGEPTVGVTDPVEILRAVAHANQSRARIFTFGVDEAAGSQLLGRMAAAHRGESIAVRAGDDLDARLPVFFGKLVQPLFEDVAIAFTGVPVTSVHPRALPHFYLGRQLVVLGRYRDPGLTTASVTAKVEGRPVRYELAIDLPDKATRAPWLERLWAQREVDFLTGDRRPDGLPGEVVEEIVRLSIAHTFATPFTSFIAVPEEDRVKLPEEKKEALAATTEEAADPNRGIGSIGGQEGARTRDVSRGVAPAAPAAPGALSAPVEADHDMMDEEPARSSTALDRPAPAKAKAAGVPTGADDLGLDAAEPPPPPAPAKDASRLENLTSSYADKLTRLTPDEREKLKTSIEKFTDPKRRLTDADKRGLTEGPTLPGNDDQFFHNRLQMARWWMMELQRAGKPVGAFEHEPKILQTLYYTNRVQAAKKLDRFVRDLAALEASPATVPAGTALKTEVPVAAPSIAAFAWPAPAAPVQDGMDARWRTLRSEIAKLRALVRAQRARVELVESVRFRAEPRAWRPVIEAVRMEPALVKGGSPARISLAVRHAAGAAPRIAWRAREGNLVAARDAAAVWISPGVPGAYTIDVTLTAADGKTYADQVDVEVYQPGTITYSPAHLDERLFHLNNALEALRREHAELEARATALPAGDARVGELVRALAGDPPRMVAARAEGARGATIRAELSGEEPAVEASSGHMMRAGVRAGSHWEGGWIPENTDWAVVTARYPGGPRFHWLVSIPVRDEPLVEAGAADVIAR